MTPRGVENLRFIQQEISSAGTSVSAIPIALFLALTTPSYVEQHPRVCPGRQACTSRAGWRIRPPRLFEDFVPSDGACLPLRYDHVNTREGPRSTPPRPSPTPPFAAQQTTLVIDDQGHMAPVNDTSSETYPCPDVPAGTHQKIRLAPTQNVLAARIRAGARARGRRSRPTRTRQRARVA